MASRLTLVPGPGQQTNSTSRTRQVTATLGNNAVQVFICLIVCVLTGTAAITIHSTAPAHTHLVRMLTATAILTAIPPIVAYLGLALLAARSTETAPYQEADPAEPAVAEALGDVA